ncbi:sigma 54-interacting transcriptional regulator [Jatrophihabitans telluris]|uniref:Sigma 54-interacting transcriptional regulator n=1 Tax=Jatrophihabitans telluris TaxID=2038343 RepID=A0ABY4R351_9ACTN|nr:sigma 54-interacting transcriptional regulator [Jatrophihabitans telluris]UQX89454.1 sigma 54-interacting transcriptional regulator [Jatrophihabitans telluris]
MTDAPDIHTLAALRASGHIHRGVKAEVRENLIARLAAGEPTLPGIVGFDDTVVPEIERALLAGHDIVLLGERGQGKTRLIRTLTGLLDEWTPVIAGSELNEHPYAPITPATIRRAADEGDGLAVSWRHRSDRYGEKLATPDTSVGDLIGDIDPIKVAEGRSLGDPDTVHYGLVPRTNRGIFAVNELPDLAERIQVALLNVLEERDIQVRGYQLRLPLDLLLIASANPEDYTNRGRIITPLKDRFGAEVRTHYPLELSDELELIAQEAAVLWGAEGESAHGAPLVPSHLLEVVGRFARAVREAPQVDQRSGVSARFAIAAVETVAASAVRRAAITGETVAVARVADLASVIPASRGKVEFDDADSGREFEVLDHLLRRAIAETSRARLAGLDLRPLQAKFDEGLLVQTGDIVSADALLEQLGTIPGLSDLLERLEPDSVHEGPATVGIAAAAVEFALEGLYLNKRLAKESAGGRAVYGA